MVATTSELLSNFLWQQSLQISVLFLVLLGLSVCFRKMSANVRYVLWMLLVVKCLVPGVYSIDLPLLENQTAAISSTPLELQKENDRQHTASNIQPSIAHSPEAAGPPLDSSIGVQILTEEEFAQRRMTWSVPSIPRILVLSWIGIACVLAGRIIFNGVRLSQQLNGSRVPVSTGATRAIDNLVHDLAIQPIRVRASTKVGQPFVWGWLSGTLYLPADFENFGSSEQRRAILAHEMAHIARLDAAANLLQTIVQVVFFFHPLVWFANRRIRLEREKCCDEFVLAAARTTPSTYCDAIVEVLAVAARQNKCSTPALAVTGTMQNLENRITSILSSDIVASARTSKRTWLLAACLACLALPTTFTLAQQSADEKGTAADEPRTEITLEAESSKEIANGKMLFRAVDPETKEPLDEVTIELQYQAEGIAFNDVKVQTTDEKGESLIVLPKGAIKTMRIYPTKPGYVPLRVFWDAQLPSSVTIPMHKGQTIGGTIRNEAGKPVADADVWIHYWGKGTGKSPHIRVNICGDNFQSKGRTKTDAKGQWQLSLLPSEIDTDKCYLYVAHPNFVSDRVIRATISNPIYKQPSIDTLRDQSSVITMRGGESIRGLVKDVDGNPIPNAKIFFDRYSHPVDESHLAVSDKEGNFEINSFDSEMLKSDGRLWAGSKPPGRFTVVAEGFGTQKVALTPTERTQIKLKPGHTIRGRVVDEQGEPIEGARVSSEERQLRLHTKTNANGDFELSSVPDGSNKFSIGKQGYMMVEQIELSTGVKNHEIELTKRLRVFGEIVDADTGKPIGKFKIWAGFDYDDGRAPDWSEWFGDKKLIDDGYEFRFSQSTLLYRLRVQADGYMPMESDILDATDPANRDIPLDFKLEKTDAKVTGKVLGLDGRPLTDAKVYLARQRFNIRNRKVTYVEQLAKDFVLTDETGKFEFPPEVEPFCIVVLHETGLGMATEEGFDENQPISIEPWDEKNHQQQIIRRPADQQYVSFPK